MKLKAFIVLLLWVFLIGSTSAQVFEYGATGYKVTYLDNELPSSTCLKYFAPNNGGFAFWGGNVTLPSFDLNTSLVIKSEETIYPLENSGFAYFSLLFVNGSNCEQMNNAIYGEAEDSNYYHVKLGGSNSKVKIKVKSDLPTEMTFGLAYTTNYNYPPTPTSGLNAYGHRSSYADGVTKTIQLTSTMTEYELDFSDWVNRSRVNMYGIYIAEPNATITIEELTIGSDSWSQYSNHIKGNIYEDVNNDCNKQPGDNGLNGVMVEATDGENSYWAVTDENGDYNIRVDSGTVTYIVTPHIRSKQATLYSNECVPAKLVHVNGSAQDFCCTDFGIQVVQCALLSVNINSDRRRRCFRSNTLVSYNNYGTAQSSEAVVKVVYPEYVKPISSVPDWSSKVGDTLIYNVGNLGAGVSGTIALIDSVILLE